MEKCPNCGRKLYTKKDKGMFIMKCKRCGFVNKRIIKNMDAYTRAKTLHS